MTILFLSWTRKHPFVWYFEILLCVSSSGKLQNEMIMFKHKVDSIGVQPVLFWDNTEICIKSAVLTFGKNRYRLIRGYQIFCHIDLERFTRFFIISNTFISNTRLKMDKSLANFMQNPEAQLFVLVIKQQEFSLKSLP